MSVERVERVERVEGEQGGKGFGKSTSIVLFRGGKSTHPLVSRAVDRTMDGGPYSCSHSQDDTVCDEEQPEEFFKECPGHVPMSLFKRTNKSAFDSSPTSTSSNINSSFNDRLNSRLDDRYNTVRTPLSELSVQVNDDVYNQRKAEYLKKTSAYGDQERKNQEESPKENERHGSNDRNDRSIRKEASVHEGMTGENGKKGINCDYYQSIMSGNCDTTSNRNEKFLVANISAIIGSYKHEDSPQIKFHENQKINTNI